MNWDRIEGNWKQLEGKIKAQWGKLTDDDVLRIEGRRDELVGKIQEAYGISRDVAERQVEDWQASIDEKEYGEGNYRASREYNSATSSYASSDSRVEDAARHAEPHTYDEAEAMRRAEEEGRNKARH